MNILNNLRNHSTKLFILILIIFSIIRIYMEECLPICIFLNSQYDDLLMINYSNLGYHFSHWDYLSLVKPMSYPIFLFFVKITTLPYTFWLGILWVIAASLTIYALYKFKIKNKIFLGLIFLFILFLPIGFYIGSFRIYRNVIQPQFAIIFLSSLFIFVVSLFYKNSSKQRIFWGIIVGLVFSFNFYIKEDGMALMPIFLIAILIPIIYNLYKNKSVSILAIGLIPILIFGISTVSYMEINNYYFGVSDINTRSDGEFGEFWNNLLLIEDSNKNVTIWVPLSTVEKAWNASPTLSSHPEVIDSFKTSPWAEGNISQNPIQGDLVNWALRKSFNDVGLYNNEKDFSMFISKVNGELEEAFDNDTLQKVDKLFFTSSITGKNFTEIMDLKPFIKVGLEDNLFYKSIDLDLNDLNLSDVSSTYYYVDNFPDKHLPYNITNENVVIGVKSVISFYKVISFVIVALSAIGFIGGLIAIIKTKFKNKSLNIIIGFEILVLGTFGVQIFAVAWFTSWMRYNIAIMMLIYTFPSQGFFAIFEVLAIVTLYMLIKNRKAIFSNS